MYLAGPPATRIKALFYAWSLAGPPSNHLQVHILFSWNCIFMRPNPPKSNPPTQVILMIDLASLPVAGMQCIHPDLLQPELKVYSMLGLQLDLQAIARWWYAFHLAGSALLWNLIPPNPIPQYPSNINIFGIEMGANNMQASYVSSPTRILIKCSPNSIFRLDLHSQCPPRNFQSP